MLLHYLTMLREVVTLPDNVTGGEKGCSGGRALWLRVMGL